MRDFVYVIFSIFVAMVGYTIHHSVFWCIMDFLFAPFTLIKWIVLHEITFSIIQQTFYFIGA